MTLSVKGWKTVSCAKLLEKSSNTLPKIGMRACYAKHIFYLNQKAGFTSWGKKINAPNIGHCHQSGRGNIHFQAVLNMKHLQLLQQKKLTRSVPMNYAFSWELKIRSYLIALFCSEKFSWSSQEQLVKKLKFQ